MNPNQNSSSEKNEEAAGPSLPSSSLSIPGQENNVPKSPDAKRQRTLSESMYPGITSSSPPKFLSFEEIMSAAKGMANMALIHEIAVDGGFEFEKVEPSENSLHKRVKDSLHKAFWDILESQLAEDPPNYKQALVLLAEIKENLLSLLLPHNIRFKENICEVLDMELIEQQVENNVLDFQYYANYVISVMQKICSPARDEKILQLKQEQNVISVFKGVLETLELMRLDMANFTIEAYKPYLIANSIDYEKNKFKEFLSIQPDSLEVTKGWLMRHVTPSTPLNTMDEVRTVIGRAYLELLTWNDENPFPETLIMDRARYLDMRNECLRLTIAATVLLLVVSNVPQLQTNQQFKVNLKQHILLIISKITSLQDAENLLPNITAQAITDCNKEISTPLSDETGKLLDSLIHQITSPEHKIRQLVFQRISDFLYTTITSTSKQPVQIPPGLTSLQQELSALVRKYHHLVSYNREVFGEYYANILQSTISTTKTQ
uniref:T-complex protein 11-like protein 1 n=1 Tax=Clastoptera arizonana TaxID=38151 RepID=A0A1B6DRJ1_9HEMI